MQHEEIEGYGDHARTTEQSKNVLEEVSAVANEVLSRLLDLQQDLKDRLEVTQNAIGELKRIRALTHDSNAKMNSILLALNRSQLQASQPTSIDIVRRAMTNQTLGGTRVLNQELYDSDARSALFKKLLQRIDGTASARTEKMAHFNFTEQTMSQLEALMQKYNEGRYRSDNVWFTRPVIIIVALLLENSAGYTLDELQDVTGYKRSTINTSLSDVRRLLEASNIQLDQQADILMISKNT